MSHCCSRAPHRLCAPSSVCLCLAVLSLMAAQFLPAAAQAQTHGTYTVGYSGGSITVDHGNAYPFEAGGGQYAASGNATANTDSYGTGQSCSVRIPDPNLSTPIMAKFTWHPDPSNPNEPPPSSAIVSQTCQASWRVINSSSGASGSGDASNGLGKMAPASTTGGDANSTLYTTWSALDPASPPTSFSVECSPSAHFSGNSGSVSHASISGSASVSYSAIATPVFIDLGGTTLVNGMREALTGQQITATLLVPNGLPTGTKITSYTWSFDGTPTPHPIKNWDGTASGDTTHPQLVPLTAADLMGTDTIGNGISVNSLGFYDQYAESLSVKCAVSLKFFDGTTATVNAKPVPVAFLKPSVTKWDIITGFIQSHGTGVWGLEPDPATSNSDGEVWKNITITVPSPFSGGSGCIVQLTKPDRETYTGTNPSPTVPNNKLEGLDGSFPYGAIWTLPGLGGDVDSPAITISGGNPGGTYSKLTASDSYTTWVMYKPATTGAIWVPLQSYTWSWAGTVSWLNGAWTLTAGTPANAAAAPQYTTADTNTPPHGH